MMIIYGYTSRRTGKCDLMSVMMNPDAVKSIGEKKRNAFLHVLTCLQWHLSL